MAALYISESVAHQGVKAEGGNSVMRTIPNSEIVTAYYKFDAYDPYFTEATLASFTPEEIATSEAPQSRIYKRLGADPETMMPLSAAAGASAQESNYDATSLSSSNLPEIAAQSDSGTIIVYPSLTDAFLDDPKKAIFISSDDYQVLYRRNGEIAYIKVPELSLAFDTQGDVRLVLDNNHNPDVDYYYGSDQKVVEFDSNGDPSVHINSMPN